MPADIVLKLENVSKEYMLYKTSCLKGMLLNLLFPYRFRNGRFTASDSLSFEIRKGECVGIMGVNGSGKSTLLQMIAGTVTPTGGRITAEGKIASLLELGSWINASDTGRENIFTLGFARGFSRKQIESQIQGIIDFAEIGAFIDQPVSTYSTGMVMRLAFASCIYLDADILLLDEIFAVGDAYFAQKCIAFLRNCISTKTVLLVSHDPNIITTLCSRALLMDRGKIVADGSPREITERYLELCYGEKQKVEVTDAFRQNIQEDFRQSIESPVFSNLSNNRSFGEGGAKITEVSFVSRQGEVLSSVRGGEKVSLKIKAAALTSLELPAIGFTVRSPRGVALWGDCTTPGAIPSLAAGQQMEAVFNFVLPRLENGSYSISAAVTTGEIMEHKVKMWSHDALIFKVNSSYPLLGSLFGIPMESIECREVI